MVYWCINKQEQSKMPEIWTFFCQFLHCTIPLCMVDYVKVKTQNENINLKISIELCL